MEKIVYFLVNEENLIVGAQFYPYPEYDDTHCDVVEYEPKEELVFANEQESEDFLKKFLNMSITHLEYVK